MTRQSLEDWVAPLGIFTLTACFLTFPIVLHLSSLVIGRPFEDAFESIWYLYWYKHALFDLQASPLFQPGVFYPSGWNLWFAVLPPLYPFLLVPLTLVTGPVSTYNLALLSSCVLAAFGTFMAVRVMGGGWWGGLFAGIAFAFYPQREVYLGGHLNFLFGSMWLPWILYGAVRAARSPERRNRWATFALISYALAIAGAWQFAVLGGVVLLVAIVAYWLPAARREPFGWGKALLVGVLAWSVIAVPLLAGALSAKSEMGEASQFPFESANVSSVSIERLLVPSGINPIFWDLARKIFPLHNGADSVVVLGYVPMILAILLLRKPVPVHGKVGLTLVAIGVIMMLGMTLHFWGKPVLISAPQFISSFVEDVTREKGVSLSAGGNVQVPLPSALLYLLLPPMRSFHNFGRWGLVSSLGIAILGGLGLTKVTRAWKKPQRIVLGGLACLLLLVEFNMQPLRDMTSTTQMHRSVDDWLVEHAGSGAIIEYPLSYTMKGQSLYYTMAHGQKIVHGYSTIPPQGYRDILPILNRWPEPSALDLLAKIGVKYILVHAFSGDNFEAKQLPTLLNEPRIRLVQVFPTPIGTVRQIYLFELRY
jgi:hypothetical protein